MISRIAIFRALYLGDMLCIIPSVRAIRTAFPAAEIALIGLPWQEDFVKRFSVYFDRFIAFPGWPGLPEQPPDAEAILKFLAVMRNCGFDLIIQMQGNGVITNSMCMLWGGKKVCGLRKDGEYAPDEELFPVSHDGEHEVLRFFKLLQALGIPEQGTHLEFPVSEDEDRWVEEILARIGAAAGTYVCVHPGARDKRRRWPVENFAMITSRIAAQGVPVILTGSMEERDLLASLQERVAFPVTNIVESFGHLSAGALACLLKGARLLVSNDTGVSHIAAALRVPSVILFSAYSEFERWRPLDNTLHIAIPYEQTSDPAYVLQRIQQTFSARLHGMRVEDSL